jgi:hypothetical protein
VNEWVLLRELVIYESDDMMNDDEVVLFMEKTTKKKTLERIVSVVKRRLMTLTGVNI